MKIESIRAADFKSYEELILKIPEPGLYLITGKNLVDEEIGSNGAGKSTIIDALSWTIFGKTVRGASGPAVEPWFHEDPSTKVTVKIDGNEIRRTRKPISLLENSEPTTDEYIEETFGCLVSSSIHGQFGNTFLDLSAAEKMVAFDSLLGLEKWTERAQKARLRAAETKNQIYYFEGRQTSQEEEVKGLKDRIKTKKKELKKAAENPEVVGMKGETEVLRKRWVTMDKKRTRLEVEVDELREDYKEREGQYAGLSSILAGIQQKQNQVLERINSCTKEIKRIEGWDAESSCPVCFSSMDKNSEEARTVLEYKNRELSEWNQAEMELQGEEAEIVGRRKEVLETKEKLEQRIEKIGEDLDDLSEEMRQNEDRGGDLLRELETSRQIEEKIRNTIENYEDELSRGKKNLKKTQREVRTSETAHKVASYWGNGFSEIRLLVIGRAVEMMGSITNSVLSDLGLPGWKVRYEMERITKAGTKSKKFHAFVSSPSSPAEVPWTSWSGGELQRLRLASSIAFKDLAAQYSGVGNSGVEFFDEPTQHLSSSGVEDLLGYLGRRAQEGKKAVFVIDHNDIEWAFSGTYQVVKEDGRSALIC